MTILYKYAKKFMEKKDIEHLTVGVVGMPNVGKSSIINVLRNKVVCATGSNPFITRGIQEVKLNSMVVIVDSPAI
jgi:ribosome biogenesis GTPase A